jgi:hypothetical protein
MKVSLKPFMVMAACFALVALGTACNKGAAPEPNASQSEQEAAEVKTPSGGGTETTNHKSVPERPPAPENTQMGSAVPPAAADQTRPHPQQQKTDQQSTQQARSSSTPPK